MQETGGVQRVAVGVVRGAAGEPLAAVEVRAESTALRALTDASGVFELRGLPTDSVRLLARRLGFRPAAVDIVVALGSRVNVEIEMLATAQQLVPVTVTARAEAYEGRLAGFYSRSKKSTGHFIGRERLDKLTSHRFSDLLREVPGVKLGQKGLGADAQRTIRLRGASCPPLVFIDGSPATAGEFDVDLIEPSTVEGVEVYQGLATVPAELLAARGGERCGVIAIWSRPYRAPLRTPRGGPISVADLLAKGKTLTAQGVDIQAELRPATAVAVFPDSLWQVGASGRVLAEFVVDTAGLVEMETVGMVSSSHPDFSKAVIEALRGTQFRPALKNGRPVRQVVQLPFVFEFSLRPLE